MFTFSSLVHFGAVVADAPSPLSTPRPPPRFRAVFARAARGCSGRAAARQAHSACCCCPSSYFCAPGRTTAQFSSTRTRHPCRRTSLWCTSSLLLCCHPRWQLPPHRVQRPHCQRSRRRSRATVIQLPTGRANDARAMRQKAHGAWPKRHRASRDAQRAVAATLSPSANGSRIAPGSVIAICTH